jgi:hypothetical protein
VSANPDKMTETKQSPIIAKAIIPGSGARTTANAIAKKVSPQTAYDFRES